ncbi:hypothetical protein P0W64_22415 [Tsukamurella sp. 8F]|uniref:hypothetical protein n=1 Tax=unclassified Tsukamurella TaxID=2633480 RepID=UPI0023B92673|nr:MULTISPECIES: hypothetical protein [unclassified Tsukamurella]MDF0531742.1 hypothetical protein [Tsukamurella sp. 8J]MDF0589544.1 hypothetical protein [Tsukamurella sp. 8F]
MADTTESSAIPRAPRGLKAAGKKLWSNTLEQYPLEDDMPKLELLEQAARVADIIADLDRKAADEPTTVKGSMGQWVINPLISESRFQRGLLASLLSKMNLGGEG